jgi:hypothetical protein
MTMPLYRIIRYSVNEVAYNEGLIGWNVGFAILRGTVLINKMLKKHLFNIIYQCFLICFSKKVVKKYQ